MRKTGSCSLAGWQMVMITPKIASDLLLSSLEDAHLQTWFAEHTNTGQYTVQMRASLKPVAICIGVRSDARMK